ncbi:unnamed protein product [Phytophthora lilii]|uniref:Unnamed protein product n=1 Tax=Phytophthora lilii TaxID=2077276 RepID=A0A9W6UBJ1_9STRA|nr:unnamed protein product [Phytophthora lilii]
MCAKNDDPLTTGQGYRAIEIQVGADASSNTALSGDIRINFLGDVAVFSANAEADQAHEDACASAFEKLRTVLKATCTISSVDVVTKGATYTVTFTEWVHLGGENNLLYHTGNPPLSSFTCDISQMTGPSSRTCAITDIVTSNVIGQCVCYADFKGMDCNQPSNIPDSIDDNDGFVINPMGLAYTGTVLHLKTAKGSQSDFYFMKIESSTLTILTMDGKGNTKLLNGDLELSTGTLTITTIAQTSTAADIASTHTTFTGTTLKVRASRPSSSSFKLLEAMSGGSTTVVEIRGDGLTTIYTGGLYVVTGGGTISHTFDAPSLTVSNSYGTFTSTLLKLTTTRASLFPATDFNLINADANGVSAFTVEASGKTTIANGGLVVNGIGGGQISNSDAAASALIASAMSATFTGDAVSIKTFSGQPHNMLKVTTKVGTNAAVDLVTIDNTGLTTITQGGLYIGTGGATINTGGLRIKNGGETIEVGGLHIQNGGELIDAGRLTVTDGGALIASLSAINDILTVEATSTSFSSDARVLYINSKSTVDPLTSMHSLIEATVGAATTSVFKVDAIGLTTIAGQGSGGASISDTGTIANTLSLDNSAPSFSKAVLGMSASDTNGGFSFIDAKVSSASVFTVDASGGTTIAAGGLTVSKGGATIADNTDASTLTLTSSVGTFTKTVLDMTASDTDGAGFSFIDAKAGSTSVFTVSP